MNFDFFFLLQINITAVVSRKRKRISTIHFINHHKKNIKKGIKNCRNEMTRAIIIIVWSGNKKGNGPGPHVHQGGREFLSEIFLSNELL